MFAGLSIFLKFIGFHNCPGAIHCSLCHRALRSCDLNCMLTLPHLGFDRHPKFGAPSHTWELACWVHMRFLLEKIAKSSMSTSAKLSFKFLKFLKFLASLRASFRNQMQCFAHLNESIKITEPNLERNHHTRQSCHALRLEMMAVFNDQQEALQQLATNWVQYILSVLCTVVPSSLAPHLSRVGRQRHCSFAQISHYVCAVASHQHKFGCNCSSHSKRTTGSPYLHGLGWFTIPCPRTNTPYS